MNQGSLVLRLLVATVLSGVILAAAVFPAAGLAGQSLLRTASGLEGSAQGLITGDAPEVTTITDVHGEPLANLYEQQRFIVESNQISDNMKGAIVSIEDRRFWEHGGVDWRGTLRAAVANFTSGSVQQGASTIEQQLIKNHEYLVAAETDAERQRAIATDYGRKIREIQIAHQLEALMDKDEILSGYLNLVPFGNGAFGIEAAAQTYYGVHASELNITQSAMLAGLVQQTTALNPYTNPDGALDRRNTVLQAMADNGAITESELRSSTNEPLGVLPEPNRMPHGCIAAGDSGYFCDFVINWLGEQGMSYEQLSRGGYTVHTTLDPEVQANAQRAVRETTAENAGGVAQVMDVIQPGEDSRRVLAMVSSRPYGLDTESSQTVQPQPWATVGNGAGSIFKIFAAASAIEHGMGIDAELSVPRRYEATGLGDGGAENCPSGLYCVENTGTFDSSMTLTETLAASPNTSFVMLAEQVGINEVVDMSVRLGMRSYLDEGSFDGESSVADYVKDHNLGSYVLGPTPVSALELANVGATLSSQGRWCAPNPVDRVTDRNGNDVHINVPPCEDAVEPSVANAMAHALALDTVDGTAEDAARSAGWEGEMAGKTGTTESNQSAAFLGFTGGLSAASYIYNDGTTTSELCTSPVRQCGSGNLFGGREPARSWFSAVMPVLDNFGGPGLNPMDDAYRSSTAEVPDVVGKRETEATRLLEEAGFRVNTASAAGTGRPRGEVSGIRNQEAVLEGGIVTLEVSDGSRPAPEPRPERESNRGGGGGTGGGGGGGGGGGIQLPPSIDIPGIGTIPLR